MVNEARKPEPWSVEPEHATLNMSPEEVAAAREKLTEEDTHVVRWPKGPSATHQVWINDNWCISVDERGHVAGPCFEGALGCVLQLTPGEGDNRLALKIPRMLADTVRENAFIAQIVEMEAEIVFKANERVGLHSGLIPVQLAQTDMLRGARQLRNSVGPEALEQEGSVLFVAFNKDGAPRFCSVRFDDRSPKPTVYPPAAADDFAFLTRDVWSQLRTPVMGGRRDFYEPTFFEVKTSGAGETRLVNHGRLSETMDLRQSNTVWYAALPSILYNWASGTLQEAVSRGRHCKWSLVQHYDLIGNVLRGLVTLHERGLIHGDVRPANVMALGDTAEPSDYALGDYGSFSSDRARLGATPSSGHTMTGAGVSRLRTSVFYSSERRNGIERESADVAIILRDPSPAASPPKDEYFVHLGWRSSLVDPETGRPTEAALETMRNDWGRMLGSTHSRRRLAMGSDKLCKGDRPRIRDYVFTVIDSDDSYGRTNFRCQRRFARVLHERIAIYNQDDVGLLDGTVISVPVYTEIRQWSAATDLYGVGALALYTVFTSGLTQMKAAGVRRPGSSGPEHDPRASAETMLAEMIEMLESVPHFLYLWPDLEDFRMTIESADDRMPSEEIAALPVVRHNHTPLSVFATQVVNNLLRGSPHVDALLHCFTNKHPSGPSPEYNVAHFLLFIHFVMSCLHRKTHLWRGSEGSATDVNDEWLFCTDRCELPISGGAAARALKRLRDLQIRCNRRDYDAFYVPADQFLKFDPRSDFQIRIELEQLRAEIQRRETCFRAHARAANAVARTSGLRRKQYVKKLIESIETTPYGRAGIDRESPLTSSPGADEGDALSLAAVARALQASWSWLAATSTQALKWPLALAKQAGTQPRKPGGNPRALPDSSAPDLETPDLFEDFEEHDRPDRERSRDDPPA